VSLLAAKRGGSTSCASGGARGNCTSARPGAGLPSRGAVAEPAPGPRADRWSGQMEHPFRSVKICSSRYPFPPVQSQTHVAKGGKIASLDRGPARLSDLVGAADVNWSQHESRKVTQTSSGNEVRSRSAIDTEDLTALSRGFRDEHAASSGVRGEDHGRYVARELGERTAARDLSSWTMSWALPGSLTKA
jgi:hypothetical protein